MLYVENYLSEVKEEIVKSLEEKKNVYLIAGCGMGKSQLAKSIMKDEKVLVVNYLNATNLQNFAEYYIPTASEVCGDRSCAINIEQLHNFSEEKLNKFDLIIIDEWQKTGLDSSYRNCCEMVYDVLSKYNGKLLVMSGTPIPDLYRGFEVLEVKKSNIEEKDNYEVTFLEGLNILNIAKLSEKLVDAGKKVVILNNSKRDKLDKCFERLGRDFNIDSKVESKDKRKAGSTINEILNTQEIPNDVDVIISTSVLQEGLNINNSDPIVFITTIHEIQNPINLIQFAGRARNQKKVIICGYNKEDDFDLNYERISEKGKIEETRDEMEASMARSFNNMNDWIKYIENYTHKCIINKGVFNNNYDYEKDENEEMKLKDIVDTIYSTGLESHNLNLKLIAKTGSKIEIEKIEGRLYLLSPKKQIAKTIIKAISLGFDCKDKDEKYLKEMIGVVETYQSFLHLLRERYQSNYDFELVAGNIARGAYSDLFGLLKDLYTPNYKRNGEELDIKDVDIKKIERTTKMKVERPIAIITNYQNTFRRLISNKINTTYVPGETENLMQFLENKSSKNLNNIFFEDFKRNNPEKEKRDRKNYKFFLISNPEVKFKTRSEAYEYCKNELGFKGAEKTFINNKAKYIKDII